MKITIEHEGHKAVVEDETVVDICEAIDLAEKAFQKVGFQPLRIRGGFVMKAKEIEKSEEDF